MTNLEKSILKTLIFFDIFDYPLTATEIWKWLYRPGKKYSLSQVRQTLSDSQFLNKKIDSAEGFYGLQGRIHIFLRSKHNNNLAERKFAKAVRLAKLYRFIPFVRMIAIVNSLAYSNAKENSDIDFFIITKRNKIWLARFFSIFFVRMFGLRPSTESNRDAFCMSFFIEEDSLNIKNIMLHSKDIYMPYWVQQMLPIYDPDGLHQKFLEANSWFRDYLPNGYANQFSKEVKENFWTRLFGNIFGFVVSPPIISRWLNNVYRRVQTNIIDNNLKSLVNIDTRVIINEKMLKFHANDRREIFYKKWREKVSKIIKPNSELIINR
ncbi:hypothetical protein HOB10_04580 [Candidatus Parcubacteria bacterium]|jgi:hypothetical protein|nr:hypothetical protein [Candidatus Parcubacteria bacterium]